MSDVRSSLTALVGALSDAVAPERVGVQDGGPPPSEPVVVRVLGLDRIGRSRRDGPVLDLELSTAVRCTGPKSLENVEQMLRALESSNRYVTTPLPAAAPTDTGIGFLVRVPVTLRLTEPEGPPIREPLEVRTVIGRRLTGVLVGPDGAGVAGALIRAGASARSASSDASGRFDLLSTPDAQQELVIEYRGSTRTVTVAAESLPLTIRWD